MKMKVLLSLKMLGTTYLTGQGSVVGIGTGLQTAQTGIHILVRDFSISRLALGCTQLCIQLIPGFFSGDKVAGEWHDLSPFSSTKIDTEWRNTSIPLCIFVAYMPPSFTNPKTQHHIPQNLNPQEELVLHLY